MQFIFRLYDWTAVRMKSMKSGLYHRESPFTNIDMLYKTYMSETTKRLRAILQVRSLETYEGKISTEKNSVSFA